MIAKYCRQLHPLQAQTSKSDSRAWKRMLKFREIVEKKLLWVVGTGNLQAQLDKWLDADLDSNSCTQPVRDYFDDGF